MLDVDEARHHYAHAEAVHDFDHVLRVLALAERLARAEGADLEIVRAAALLHDAGRGQGVEHAAAGADLARRVLVDQPPDRVEAVAHAIAAHRFRRGPAPATLEARVVHDADKLDAIGAIGVARAFHYGGHWGQRLWAEVPPDYEETPDSLDVHTPVHEYVYKLARIKDRLLTASARRLADERHAFMVAFFARLHREVHGLA
ncbi:MAG: HD domain-containing protein [Anaerolineae bacterium]